MIIDITNPDIYPIAHAWDFSKSQFENIIYLKCLTIIKKTWGRVISPPISKFLKNKWRSHGTAKCQNWGEMYINRSFGIEK